MKKCPYCDKDIHTETIICMYCKGDLRTPAASQGAKAAVVFSVLYIVGILSGNAQTNGAGLVGRLTVGLLWTFLIWWVVCTFIVLLWRSILTTKASPNEIFQYVEDPPSQPK